MGTTLSAVILATEPASSMTLWGMSLYEKIARQLSNEGFDEVTILVEPGHHLELRPDFAAWNHICVRAISVTGTIAETLCGILQQCRSHVAIISGHAGFDARVLARLRLAIKQGDSLHLRARDQPSSPIAACLCLADMTAATELASVLASSRRVRVHYLDELDEYLLKTRRRVPPYAVEIRNMDDLRKLEKLSFRSVYKGATDFVTKFVWPWPVRQLVKGISPTRITPNQLTSAGLLLSFGSIPLYVLGMFPVAIICGWVLSVIDTLDGKLARLTMRTSTTGHVLDNVFDSIYLPLWYVALGWNISGGQLFEYASPASVATWALLFSYLLDKIGTGLFKRVHGVNLHDFARLDYVVRTFIARRNPFLVGMSLALVLGWPALGLYIIAIWNVMTALFHWARFVQLSRSGRTHQSLDARSAL